jgi:hypothetical protein
MDPAARARPEGLPSGAAAFCTEARIDGEGRARKGTHAFGSGAGMG